MTSLASLIETSGVSWRPGATPAVRWLSIDGSSMRIELAAIEEGTHMRFLFVFGDAPVDTSADLLVYYLQLNSDMSLFRLFLRPDNRICLTGRYAIDALDPAGFRWLAEEFAQYCDYYYPDLVVE